MSRLIYNNCGSEHQPDSACLGDMLAVLMEDESAPIQPLERLSSPQPETMDANISEDCQTVVQSEEKQIEILKGCISCTCPAELDLLAETAKFLDIARKLLQQQQKQPECLKQSVMSHLRNVGYDAAICRSRPKDNSRSFPAGNYEYMDVIMKSTNSGRSIRLIVDMDFKAQFEIARPTTEYSALLGLLPKIYVGRDQRLQAIVKIMCEGVKNSLKKMGMHLPPWRKYKYMHSMWFGSYNRTEACNSLQDGYGSNKTSIETSPVTELTGMCHLKQEVKGIRHVWNTIHAAGEYLSWDSPAEEITLSKPSTGKLIISTLARALMEAGLTSLSTTVEPERLCLPEALTEVATA